MLSKVLGIWQRQQIPNKSAHLCAAGDHIILQDLFFGHCSLNPWSFVRCRWRCLLPARATTKFFRTPPQKERKAWKPQHDGKMWEEEMLASLSEQGLSSWCQLFAQSTQPPVLLCTPTEHIPRDWIMKPSLAPFFTNTSPPPPTFLFTSQATCIGNVFSCAFLTVLLGVSPLVCIQGQTKVFIFY